MINDLSQISERERDILRLVATGATNQQIAYQLNISVNTVKVHLRNIFGKIGVTSRTEATLFAVRTGLVQVGEAAQRAPDVSVALADEAPEDELALVEPLPADPEPVEPATDGLLVADADQPKPVAPARPAPSRRPLLLGGALLALAVVAGIVVLALRLLAAPTASPSAASTSGPVISPPAVENRWRELAPMPTGRAGFALASYSYDNNQYLYVIGGETSGAVVGELLRYQPSANTWVQLTAKPTPVSDVQAVVIGNKIYVPGGRLQSGESTDAFEAYDPQRDKWIALKPLPQKRSGYALAAFEGKLYLFGGWDGVAYHAEVWQYNTNSNSWSERTPMRVGRAYAGAAVAEEQGQIYVIGGHNADGDLTVNESYSPAVDDESGRPWSTKTPLPLPSSHIATAAITTISPQIFAIGGTNASSQLVQYDSAADSWSAGSIGISQIRDLRVQSIGNKLYLIGGRDSAGISAKAYEYQAVYSVFLPISK